MKIKVARIKKIDLKINSSAVLFLIIMGLYAMNFYKSVVPDVGSQDLIIFGIVSAIVIVLSIALHEVAHLIVSRRLGLTVTEFGLNFVNLKEQPHIPRSEIKLSIIGPITNLIIGLIFWAISRSSIDQVKNPITISLFFLGFSNIGIAFFNLIPAFPLDGGRLLRAYLWIRTRDYGFATKVVSNIGSILGYSIMIYSVYLLFLLQFSFAIWLSIVGGIFASSAPHTLRNSTSFYIKLLKNDFDDKNKSIVESSKCF